MTASQTVDRIKETADRIMESEGFDIEKTGRFTLAEAIMEGCDFSGQAVGSWSDSQGNLCALSAGFASATARGYVDL